MSVKSEGEMGTQKTGQSEFWQKRELEQMSTANKKLRSPEIVLQGKPMSGTRGRYETLRGGVGCVHMNAQK